MIVKKFFVFILSAAVLPVIALCPIDSGEDVCTLPNSNSTSPLFQNPNASTNINRTGTPLQTRQEDKFDRVDFPEKSNMNYNTGCQFGNCLYDLNNTHNKSQ